MSLSHGIHGVAIAEQALNNLVNQFARPLDFLRELAQNSMDAGTPRVEVRLDFEPPAEGNEDGVLGIHVVDFGEGMDEAIIDDQLTRLFSSNKEGDLTKIGKFGIGFTSVFAIRPDAVLVRTGRHGESWELLFHADRSYEKRRSEEAVTGTHVTLFKRMNRQEAESFAEETRYVLSYWCEHSDIPITFEDTIAATVGSALDTEQADPFAAFAGEDAVGGAERIDRPLELRGTEIALHETDADWELLIGFSAKPVYGYYNGGLTLVNTDNTDVLGAFADQLGHISFKIKSDALEHTLTRDNVLQDVHWERLMTVIVARKRKLIRMLLDRIEQAVTSGEPCDDLYGHLADEVECAGGARKLLSSSDHQRMLFRDHLGEPMSLKQLEAQESRYGAVLMSPGTEALAEALSESGVRLLEPSDALSALLFALTRPPVLGVYVVSRKLVNGGDWFVLPQVLKDASLTYGEQQLMERTRTWVERATRNKLSVKIGNFGGREEALTEAVAIKGPRSGRLFQKPETTWFQWPEWMGGRCMLVNRHHGHYQALVAAASEDLELAAFALASALLRIGEMNHGRCGARLVGMAGRSVGVTRTVTA